MINQYTMNTYRKPKNRTGIGRRKDPHLFLATILINSIIVSSTIPHNTRRGSNASSSLQEYFQYELAEPNTISNSLILHNEHSHIAQLSSKDLERRKRSISLASQNSNSEKCTCQWTEWMNSHNPMQTKNQEENETIENLRQKFDFCKKPKDVNCRAVTEPTLFLNKGDHHCSLTGFICNLFCFDFELRFKCCQCIPEDISMPFRIHLYKKESGNKHNTDLSKCLYYSESEEYFKYGEFCNTDHSIFNWVSGYKLKVRNKCVSPDSLDSNAKIGLQDCDETLITQDFEPKDSYYSKTDYFTQIRLKHRYRYITLTDDGKFSVGLHYTNSKPNSKFLARLVTKTGNYQQEVFQISAFSGRECDKLQNNGDRNGRIDCTFSNLVQSTCRKVCNPGYQLPDTSISSSSSGRVSQLSTEVTCMVEGDNGFAKWTDADSVSAPVFGNRANFPFCVKTKCDLALISSKNFLNGRIDCSKHNESGSNCKFICNTGYKRVGSSTTVCRNSGDWSIDEKDKPYCQKITCPDIVVNHDARLRYSCSKKINKFEYQSECTIQCTEGFNLNGGTSSKKQQTTVCQEDGNWSNNFNPTALSCGARNCPELTTENNRGLSISCDKGRTTGSRCTYSCDTPRWEMELGTKILSVCQSNGQWSLKEVPTCHDMACFQWNTWDKNVDITCKVMPASNYNALHRRAKRSPNPYPSSLYQDSFEITDFGQIMAGQSDTIGTTKTVGATADGFVLPNTLCELNCNQGYTLKGPRMIKCARSDRQMLTSWIDAKTREQLGTQNPQKCEIIKCKEIKNFENGSFKCYNTTTSGSNSNSASNNKRRNKRSIDTGLATQIPNTGASRFFYGSRCSFSCNEGYKLDVRDVDTLCNENGWSSPPADGCHKIVCPAFDENQFKNGKIECNDAQNYGSKCKFVCNNGYKLMSTNLLEDDSTTSECQKNGEWTNSLMPTCRPVNCKDPFAVDSRLADRTVEKPSSSCSKGFDVGSICSYSCNQGYKLNNLNPKLTCLDSGEWSGIAPVCEAISCKELKAPTLPFPNHEDLVEAKRLCTPDSSNKNMPRHYKYPTKCVFYCSPGYNRYPTAQNTFTCNENGDWIFAGSSGDEIMESPPFCKPIKCTELSRVRSGTQFSCTNENRHESVLVGF